MEWENEEKKKKRFSTEHHHIPAFEYHPAIEIYCNLTFKKLTTEPTNKMFVSVCYCMCTWLFFLLLLLLLLLCNFHTLHFSISKQALIVYYPVKKKECFDQRNKWKKNGNNKLVHLFDVLYMLPNALNFKISVEKYISFFFFFVVIFFLYLFTAVGIYVFTCFDLILQTYTNDAKKDSKAKKKKIWKNVDP